MKQDLKIESFLSNLPLFKEALPAEIERITAGTRALHAQRGEVLFRRGDSAEGFYLVVYGQVKLAFTSARGVEKVVEIIGPGMSFGEAVMFLQIAHVVYAETLSDAMLLCVSKRVVFHEIDHNPGFARKMLGGLSRRLHGVISDVEAYCLRSGAQRVIGYLLRDAEAGDAAAGTLTVDLPINKGVIASRLNLTPQHFSRILHDLIEDGLIEVQGRMVRILDMAKLRQYE